MPLVKFGNCWLLLCITCWNWAFETRNKLRREERVVPAIAGVEREDSLTLVASCLKNCLLLLFLFFSDKKDPVKYK